MSAASSLCVRDEVSWTEDLIKETMKRLHDLYTILTLIEHDMSAQLNSSLPNLIPRVFARNTHAGFWNEDAVNSVSPTLNFRKDLPILILTGGLENKNQSNFPVSEVYSN